MKYSLRFLPHVEDDAITAYTWYQEKLAGLGDDFLRTFYSCAAEIADNPLLYAKVYREFRRRLMKRFPYAIYFRLIEHQVVVSGLFHCARNPQTLERRLRDRERSESP